MGDLHPKEQILFLKKREQNRFLKKSEQKEKVKPKNEKQEGGMGDLPPKHTKSVRSFSLKNTN